MKLIILDHQNQLNSFKAYLKENLESLGDFCVLGPLGLKEKLPEGARSVAFKEMTEEEQLWVDDTANRLAVEWTERPECVRLMKYRDVSLGKLLVHGLDYFWVRVLKQMKAVESAFEEEKPEKIICFPGIEAEGTFFAARENYFVRIAIERAKLKGVDFEVVGSFQDSKNTNSSSYRPSLFHVGFYFLFSIIRAIRGLFSSTKPKVAMSASPRVGKSLLDYSQNPFQWIYVNNVINPRYYLRNYFQGVSSFVLSKKRTEGIEAGKLLTLLSSSDLFCVNEISLFSVCKKRFELLFSNEWKSAISLIDEAQSFFKRNKIESLILDEDVTFFHKILAEVARVCFIPSIVIQHGITGQKRGFTPFSTDQIAVWGEMSKQQLIRWGIPEKNIVITGFPGRKKALQKSASEKNRIKKDLGIPERHKVIFYPANRLRFGDHGLMKVKLTFEQGIQLLKAICNSVEELNETTLLIKMHPGDKIEYFKPTLDQLHLKSGVSVQVIDAYDISSILSISDVVVNMASTVCVDAMAYQLPVVNVNLFKKIDYIPFGEKMPVRYVAEEALLGSELKLALEKGNTLKSEQESFLKSYYGPTDGKEVERLIEAIHCLVKRYQKIKKLGIVIQARMSSERLPGKVLKAIQGKTVLEHLLDRLEKVVHPSQVILATSKEKSDDPVSVFAKKRGVLCFRGDLDHVLDRFYQAANKWKLDPIIRITADCPLIEPGYITDLINLYRDGDLDYASAKDPEAFPRGTTAEILSFSSLKTAWQKAETDKDKEHVTWYNRRHSERFKLGVLSPRREWQSKDLRLALDEPLDLEVLERLFKELNQEKTPFGLDEILSLAEKSPHLFELNKTVIQKDQNPEV